jgi:hypothetical protein
MSGDERDPEVDLSVTPETMMAIRERIRQHLVEHIHALRIAARAYRKAGFHEQARRYERDARRIAHAVAALDNPMSMLTFPSRSAPDSQDEA